MPNHWEPLTLFLRVPKAPLDNNLCERALKRVILHRKNSLFFKTDHGADVGDLFMSLIHTCAPSPRGETFRRSQRLQLIKHHSEWIISTRVLHF